MIKTGSMRGRLRGNWHILWIWLIPEYFWRREDSRANWAYLGKERVDPFRHWLVCFKSLTSLSLLLSTTLFAICQVIYCTISKIGLPWAPLSTTWGALTRFKSLVILNQESFMRLKSWFHRIICRSGTTASSWQTWCSVWMRTSRTSITRESWLANLDLSLKKKIVGFSTKSTPAKVWPQMRNTQIKFRFL